MTRPARTREPSAPAAPRRPGSPPGTPPGDRPDVGADEFRRALGAHPAGVVVVTADDGGHPVGLTATSFTSVSLAPPLVAFYVAASSSTWPRLRGAGHFAVNLLTEDQREVAARFARRGDRFAPPTEWTRGPDGTPLLGGAAAHLSCRLHRIEEVGDHWLVVGRVRTADVHSAARPLLYHQGAFGGLRPLP
ncbi:flavin reductase family protein [Nocardiopsis mangrovi]|uniref:Flavin reductase family protein n=1 Tax=Nocardiopsis mangrovi TaxID=1179818 RepID=A0ABV9E1Y4_9ACTN